MATVGVKGLRLPAQRCVLSVVVHDISLQLHDSLTSSGKLDGVKFRLSEVRAISSL